MASETRPNYMLPTGGSSQPKGKRELKSKEMGNNTPNKWHSKKASIAVLTSDKIDSKPKSSKRQIWTVFMINGQFINY